MNSPLHLFVYGTLRRSGTAPLAARLEREGEFVGTGRVRGRLYDLGGFPGMRDALGGDEWVRGDVFLIPEPGAIVPLLDEYERCAGKETGPGEYRRVVREAFLAAGGHLQVHLYLCRLPVDEGRRIISGEFGPPDEARGATQ